MSRRVQTGVAVAGLVAGLAAGALVLESEHASSPWARAILGCSVGWSLIASGLAVAHVRPANRLGWVLVATGFAWFATFLEHANGEVASTLGIAAENLYLVGFVYLVLAFPSGRLRGRLDRALVLAAAVLATVVEWAWLLVAPRACGGCPGNAVQVARQPELADALLALQRWTGAALALATVALLVVRWRAASPSARRQAAPVMWAGAAVLVALALAIVNDATGAPLADAPELIVAAVLALLPVAVLAVLARGRLDRGAVAALVVELGDSPASTDVQGALARALGDPSLSLAYWLPRQRRYVDRDGRPVDVTATADRQVTQVERGGRRIAALVHDPALGALPELVESACAAAALALDNAQLETELRVRAQELQSSRARLVEAGERERRRIERDLHDGAQQHMVSVTLLLGLARAREAAGKPVAQLLAEAQGQLADALEELRSLSQGILPPILRERGLEPALRELGKRFPLQVETTLPGVARLPLDREAALYFVAGEALTNAAKHAAAERVVMELREDGEGVCLVVRDDGVGGADPTGSGLQGLVDRVGALGGRLDVGPPADGTGTVVEAWMPCASS